MRSSRGSVRFVLAMLAGLFSAGSARAQLLVATTPGDPPAIAHAELAFASGAGMPVTWLSLRIARGPVALVAALPKDALTEPALDAWFAALEATASPNVLLPENATDCGSTTSFVHVAWPRAAGVDASELSLQAPEDVSAALDEQGVTLTGKLPAAARYLVWSWPAADTEQTTRTLRIEGGAAPLTLAPGSPFPILVSAVTRGATSWPLEHATSELAVTFVAGESATTDYRDRLRDFLDGGSSALVEMRARGPLFDWAIYDDRVSLSPLVSSYATRAKLELPELDVDVCTEQLRALRKADAPAATACGDARDASLALAAAGTELPTLQRFAVSASSGIEPSGTQAGGDPSAPVVQAKKLDDSACRTEQLPPIVLQPPPQRGGPAPEPAPSGNTSVVVEETVVVDQPTEVNCGGSPQPEPQDGYYADHNDNVDCSSDTSSSSESDSNDSCSGDSSSSSTDSNDSCSGDSSSSSTDSNDSGCSSDTSSTSDSSSSTRDSGCSSGSSDSSYDGDTCSGNARPGAERSEKAQASLRAGAPARGPRRMKTSLWAMALVALVLPIRRRKRS
jgi:hypothetical protein